MAKDPAFLFYPNDWQGGTAHFTIEEKGAYMELLILQFNHGPFTEAYAQRVLGICFGNVWPVVSEKFKLVRGKYVNERLQDEAKKRLKYSESRRKNAKGSPKKTEAYAKHMGNGNEDGNRIRNKDENVSVKSDFFEKFWAAYGNPIKRSLAERAFVNSEIPPDKIIEAAAAYHAYCIKSKRRKQDPHNWLNEKGYLTDWLQVAKSDKSQSKDDRRAMTIDEAYQILNNDD